MLVEWDSGRPDTAASGSASKTLQPPGKTCSSLRTSLWREMCEAECSEMRGSKIPLRLLDTIIQKQLVTRTTMGMLTSIPRKLRNILCFCKSTIRFPGSASITRLAWRPDTLARHLGICRMH